MVGRKTSTIEKAHDVRYDGVMKTLQLLLLGLDSNNVE